MNSIITACTVFAEVLLGAADLVWVVEGNVAVGGARCAATSASASGHLFEGSPRPWQIYVSLYILEINTPFSPKSEINGSFLRALRTLRISKKKNRIQAAIFSENNNK